MSIIKMIAVFTISAALSYFTIRVTSHYLAKNGVFDLSKPAEFISVFATIIFYTLFSYKACNELGEILEDAKPEVKYFTYDPDNYTQYEDLGKNSPLK
jgi:hypothetical protein